jgi:hypothetical protein
MNRVCYAFAVDAEQEQLDVLLLELSRIERQQTKLKAAVSNSQAIVVHPRKEVGQSINQSHRLGR